jgi:Trypsin
MVGSTLSAVGWGTQEFAGPSSSILMKVNLNVISNTECAKKMQNIDITKICTFNGK